MGQGQIHEDHVGIKSTGGGVPVLPCTGDRGHFEGRLAGQEPREALAKESDRRADQKPDRSHGPLPSDALSKPVATFAPLASAGQLVRSWKRPAECDTGPLAGGSGTTARG